MRRSLRPRSAIAGAIAFFAVAMAGATCAQEVHFSTEERPYAIDVELISTAKTSIDFAS